MVKKKERKKLPKLDGKYESLDNIGVVYGRKKTRVVKIKMDKSRGDLKNKFKTLYKMKGKVAEGVIINEYLNSLEK